ncbi:hypothetical protein BDV19DRAFT_358891 [Aspergillus venezuelensis]
MAPLLDERASATTVLYADPHNPARHLTRGQIHERLGFPDLAAADAYRALSLLDSVVDPDGCEFHARRRNEGVTFSEPPAQKEDSGDVKDEDEEEDDDENNDPISEEEYRSLIGPVYALLVRSLVKCGCLRDAYEFALRGRTVLDEIETQNAEEESSVSDAKKDIEGQIAQIKTQYRTSKGKEEEEREDINPSALKAQGFARRILYPWNEHEPDRKSPETLVLLNERLKDIAPKCEVRAVALPALHNQSTTKLDKKKEDSEDEEVSIQLGLFAKTPLAPGETILHESSLLTATNRLHDDLCDACNAPLPDLSSPNPPVACDECYDTIFCSTSCHDRAQEIYHGAVCGLMENLEAIGKDIPDAKDKADYLYLLLLGRALAMAETQGVHPLDLPEVKYIWGDFVPESEGQAQVPEGPSIGTLPFSFHLSILQPMRLIEEMQVDPYANLARYDTWVLNTLYAKFRGTASGRLSTWDGGPETCAVHPLWCLANHSCDPNVRWGWGGEISFVVRGAEERAIWKRKDGEEKAVPGRGEGIKKDQEILNHYCDIGLDVKERREWAAGALGGKCLCDRCVWEAGAVDVTSCLDGLQI